MPTAAEFQALHDELRQLGAVFVQAASLGDQELALWAVGALSSAAARPAWWAREAAENESGSRGGCRYREGPPGRMMPYSIPAASAAKKATGTA
ncbi:TPA: hypothetical protein ACNVQ0_006493 [Pseudomonas aeruginosa]